MERAERCGCTAPPGSRGYDSSIAGCSVTRTPRFGLKIGQHGAGGCCQLWIRGMSPPEPDTYLVALGDPKGLRFVLSEGPHGLHDRAAARWLT